MLADGAICCIDEFEKLKPHGLNILNEALEQQTLSVSKAGIIAQLNTRCGVLAALRPNSFDLNTKVSPFLLLIYFNISKSYTADIYFTVVIS